MSDGRHKTARRPDGTRIHYVVSGPEEFFGTPFLWVHGLGSNWTRWKAMLGEPYFLGRRSIIPDLRGHGESTARRGIDEDGMAADLKAILDQERVGRTVAVGHCLGANITVRFWETYPESVAALVLIEPFVVEHLRRLWRFLNTLSAPLISLVAAGVLILNAVGLRRTRFRRIDYSVYDDWVRPRLTHVVSVIRWMGPWMDLRTMPVVAYLRAYRILFRYRPPWERLGVPVLAVLARQGGVLSEDPGWNPLSRPGIRTVVIRGSHFMLTDNRAGVAREIETFVESLKEGGS